ENDMLLSPAHRSSALLLAVALFPLSLDTRSANQQPTAAPPKLLIAFASFRERKLHPKVYFYEHDGVADGKLVGSIDAVNQRGASHPSLTPDGRLWAFASELENQTGKVLLWDRTDKKLIDLPAVNDTPNGQMHPTLTADGKWLALAAWDRPGV